MSTNNLVSEDPEEVAVKMDGLIEDLKDHTKKIAVSSVIKWYDDRVPASNITHFNNLVNNLCSKHNILFLNNDHKDRSFLNRSNFHLNQSGDRLLGSAYCTYLKSIRVLTAGNILKPVGNDRQVLHQAYGHRISFLMDNQRLSLNLSGFLKNHSCCTALLKMTEDWREKLDEREAVAAVAVDLSKAFD